MISLFGAKTARRGPGEPKFRPVIAKMAREDRLRRAEALLKGARRAYRALRTDRNPEELSALRISIERILAMFSGDDISHVPVLAALQKSLQHLPVCSGNTTSTC